MTGGVPYGFNVGIKPGDPGGPILAAFNEGIKGMAVGTVRTMIGKFKSGIKITTIMIIMINDNNNDTNNYNYNSNNKKKNNNTNNNIIIILV